MKLADIPTSPAYLVNHDPYMNGAMDVWPMASIELAELEAKRRNDHAESMGYDDAARWKAYSVLPRVRVWKYHG